MNALDLFVDTGKLIEEAIELQIKLVDPAVFAEAKTRMRERLAHLAPELARRFQLDRAVYADKPEDRLYHADDNTWWRRTPEGNLVHANPPEPLVGVTRQTVESWLDELQEIKDIDPQMPALVRNRRIERLRRHMKEALE